MDEPMMKAGTPLTPQEKSDFEPLAQSIYAIIDEIIRNTEGPTKKDNFPLYVCFVDKCASDPNPDRILTETQWKDHKEQNHIVQGEEVPTKEFTIMVIVRTGPKRQPAHDIAPLRRFLETWLKLYNEETVNLEEGEISEISKMNRYIVCAIEDCEFNYYVQDVNTLNKQKKEHLDHHRKAGWWHLKLVYEKNGRGINIKTSPPSARWQINVEPDPPDLKRSPFSKQRGLLPTPSTPLLPTRGWYQQQDDSPVSNKPRFWSPSRGRSPGRGCSPTGFTRPRSYGRQSQTPERPSPTPPTPPRKIKIEPGLGETKASATTLTTPRLLPQTTGLGKIATPPLWTPPRTTVATPSPTLVATSTTPSPSPQTTGLGNISTPPLWPPPRTSVATPSPTTVTTSTTPKLLPQTTGLGNIAAAPLWASPWTTVAEPPSQIRTDPGLENVAPAVSRRSNRVQITFTCKSCGCKFSMLKKGSKYENEDLYLRLESFTCQKCKTPQSRENPIDCPICHENFDLNHHLKTQHKVKPVPCFICNICSKMCPDKNSLISHRNEVHKE